MQPTLGFLQALQQRHVGQVREMCLSGANHRFPQRVSAAEVQQEGPQEVVDRLVFAQPLQRPGVPRQLAPTLGEERHQHIPVLVHHAGLRVMHLHARIRRPSHENKLAPMGPCPRRPDLPAHRAWSPSPYPTRTPSPRKDLSRTMQWACAPGVVLESSIHPRAPAHRPALNHPPSNAGGELCSPPA